MQNQSDKTLTYLTFIDNFLSTLYHAYMITMGLLITYFIVFILPAQDKWILVPALAFYITVGTAVSLAHDAVSEERLRRESE